MINCERVAGAAVAITQNVAKQVHCRARQNCDGVIRGGSTSAEVATARQCRIRNRQAVERGAVGTNVHAGSDELRAVQDRD